MKKWCCAAALVVAACQQNGNDSATPDEAPGQAPEAVEFDGPNAAELIREGKPQACAHPEVKEFILRTITDVTPEIRRNYASGLSTTQADIDAARADIGEVQLSNFQALDSDPQTGQLLCKMAYTIPGDSDPTSRTYAMQYFLRQSLENPDDFMMDGNFGTAAVSYQIAIEALAAERLEARTPEPEPEPEAEPAEPVEGM